MREGWEYKKLGEVCKVTMGQSPDGTSINDKEGMEFHQGKTCFGERYLKASPLFSNAPIRIAEANSVLLCVRAPVGYPNITEKTVCIGRGLCSLVVRENINHKFLYYTLLGKQSYFEKNATGSTFKAISSKVVVNTPISLPPKSVQLEIVSELDQINELIRLKKELLKDYDNLAPSIFYEMFGDPVENDKGWDVKKLGDIAAFKNGLNFGKAEKGITYKFLGVSDFQDNTFVCSDRLGTIELSQPLSEEYLLEEGDIVFVRSNGSKELVGRNVLMHISEPTTYSGFCIRCRLTVEGWDPVFLSFLLKTSSMRPLITNSGRGCNISNLNQKILGALPVIDVSFEKQQEFSSLISRIERLKAGVSNAIADLETLLASRMQYWFE